MAQHPLHLIGRGARPRAMVRGQLDDPASLTCDDCGATWDMGHTCPDPNDDPLYRYIVSKHELREIARRIVAWRAKWPKETIGDWAARLAACVAEATD